MRVLQVVHSLQLLHLNTTQDTRSYSVLDVEIKWTGVPGDAGGGSVLTL